jgi:16S rRNA (guanine527-N7)-methyltransferase
MTEISDSRLSEILEGSGIEPEAAPFSAIRAYIDLLLLWNSKISLTTIENPEEIVRLHFGESFFAASILNISQGRLADVGSGAGFPGVPIKMLAPALQLSLIEANAKKAAFLSEVLRKLILKPTEVLNVRMEDLPEGTIPFDFVTARAVGDHKSLLRWARRHLRPSGKLVLFLGADDATELSRERGWSWDQIRIPQSKRRVLLVGSSS